MKPLEEHVLLDLVERGVHLIPSATAQMASKSKAFQAKIFSPWMIPETTVIYDVHFLLETINRYKEMSIEKVVLKHDRKNAGAGILLYSCIEDVYNQAANNVLSFPFVLQPFIPESEDVRVIVIDDYIEAYKRSNPNNFRNNLHCGGTAAPFGLSDKCFAFCMEVMKRGNFPYGHLDLMMTEEGKVYLAEINLRGGIRGAQITTAEYKERIASINKKLLSNLQQ
jgi:glutathione synthase/RimK-type ligase-like ATP-grasp enzyme